MAAKKKTAKETVKKAKTYKRFGSLMKAYDSGDAPRMEVILDETNATFQTKVRGDADPETLLEMSQTALIQSLLRESGRSINVIA